MKLRWNCLCLAQTATTDCQCRCLSVSALDQVLGARTVHTLWHLDREQRQRSGRSRDMISNLLGQPALRSAVLSACPVQRRGVEAATTSGTELERRTEHMLAALFGAFAKATLTLDWGTTQEQSAALLRAAEPLDPLRFTPLCPMVQAPQPESAASASDSDLVTNLVTNLGAATSIAAINHSHSDHADADPHERLEHRTEHPTRPPEHHTRPPEMLWWTADGSRPLRRCGFATHRLEAHSRGAGERASVTVVALPAVVLPAHRAGAPPPPPPLPFELIIGVVGYDPHTCTRYDETSPALSCMQVLTTAPCLSPQVRRDEPGTLGDDPRGVSGTPLVRASTGRRVLTQRVRGAGEGRGLYAAAVGDTTGHAATF